jgi:hypothetical protein
MAAHKAIVQSHSPSLKKFWMIGCRTPAQEEANAVPIKSSKRARRFAIATDGFLNDELSGGHPLRAMAQAF